MIRNAIKNAGVARETRDEAEGVCNIFDVYFSRYGV
jgi:hypothetical protein